MAKYRIPSVSRKTVGAYLRAVKALNALQDLGEDVGIHPWEPRLQGTAGSLAWDELTGQWTFNQE